MNAVSILAVFPLTFGEPVWLWLLATIPLLVVFSYRSLAGLERGRRLLALALRSLVIAAITIALARASFQKESDRLTVIFVLDRSRSIPHGPPVNLLIGQEIYVKELIKYKPTRDKVGVVSFSGEAYLEQLPMRNLFLKPIPPASIPDVTNIAQGFRLAMASFPDDTARRIVVLTDGNENAGDVLREIAIAEAAGVSVDVVPMRYEHRNEVFFDRLVTPTQARMQERIPIRMILRSDHAARGQIYLTHNGEPVPLGENGELGMAVELNAGRPTPLQMRLPMNAAGPHEFEARFVPEDASQDQLIENNRATAFTFVGGKGLVLLLSTDHTEDQPLFDALAREKIEVVMPAFDDVSINLLELQQYSAIILCNVPADLFTGDEQEVLAQYVKDFGGGLIMTGGNEGFGAGGWIGSPVEAVMPVDFEIKQRRIIPRGALVVVMDPSELGRANYWGEAVAVASLKTISSMDYFGCIIDSPAAGGLNWEVPLAIAQNKTEIVRRLQKMQVGDIRSLVPLLEMATAALKGLGTRAAQKHIIIISDGSRSPGNFTAVFKDMNANKITCSTVAIGYGVHVFEEVLKKIAKATGGRFYPVRNPKRLPQIFTKEAKIIRRPLISEQPFTPQLVYSFSPLMMGLTDTNLPPLGGMVLTQKKSSAQVEMPLVRGSKDGNDPVLVHWQYELGRAVAFTSGYWVHWGTDWVAWDQFSKLWGQTVRWAMRQSKASEFQVFTRLEGGQGRVVIEALNTDASYLNFLRLRSGRVIGPDGEPKELRLTQTGPGRYEAIFDARQRGQYLINMAVSTPDDNEAAFISTGLAIPFSPEYRDLSTNEPLLARMLETSRDSRELIMDPKVDADAVYRRPIVPTIALQPVWNWVLAWLLLPLFLLDVASRRLASIVALSIFVELLVVIVLLFGVGVIHAAAWGILGVFVLAEGIGWLIRWRSIEPALQWLTHSVSVLGRTGERSTAALSQLKTTRDKVRETLTAGGDPGTPPPPPARRPADEPVPDRKRRFDVGDQAEAEAPTADLAATMDGAKEGDVLKRPQRKPAAAKREAPEENMTSRLLRAKRRAKEDLDDRKKDE